jgi:hypothetical protein
MAVDGQCHAPAALQMRQSPGTNYIGECVDAEFVWTGAENLASHRDSIDGPFSP